MNKLRLAPTLFLSLILLVSIVTAAGYSTKTDDSKPADVRPYKDRIMDNLKTRAGHIDRDKIHEMSCENVKNVVACERLYQITSVCYDKTGLERGKCLREKIGVRADRMEDKETKRGYLVLLLYDLQKRVERQNENGKITDEDAATLIAKILDIKHSIQNGDSRAEVKAELQDLRTLWKSIFQKDTSTDDTASDSGNSQDDGAGSDDDSGDQDAGDDSGGENAN